MQSFGLLDVQTIIAAASRLSNILSVNCCCQIVKRCSTRSMQQPPKPHLCQIVGYPWIQAAKVAAFIAIIQGCDIFSGSYLTRAEQLDSLCSSQQWQILKGRRTRRQSW